ncbi:hypothetical protein GGS23DRAFT_599895 [Durotheca rogersii]|uniref:uncharacterized protein n=1 Tax=Durotheca rogersii TaxID=419775 RepID=UPI0022211D80|nr:uncharacterized protein GGS23DRAFT_599895 [Durotheca rogersii]KAI5859965.1 hypothetical protein GGS23DRAFT_599895 [Durotheca rogersii]
MYYTLVFLAVLLAPFMAGAAPTPTRPGLGYAAVRPTTTHRAKPSVVTPPPCVAMDPPPSEEETRARFDEFANAFLVTRNLTNAFEYVSSVYINHNPFAEDGPNAALDFLDTMWNTTKIAPIRTAFKGDQGWLNYIAAGMGEIVDRFRWEAGCIVEHWDQEEIFPEEALAHYPPHA